MERTRSYFVTDVHLGLAVADPAEREERFVSFLNSLPADTKSLYLLGDIWDFWYEYRDVVPREGFRVLAALSRLVDEGVEVWFIPGNHDIWTFSFFSELGIRKAEQPLFVKIGDAEFCLGHGDGLGGARRSYRFMLSIFHCRFLQRCFSTLHPRIAFSLARLWSGSNRRCHEPYHFRGEDEPLWRYAAKVSSEKKLDYCIFGHFHDAVDTLLPTGARLIVLKDWIGGGMPHAVFDEATSSFSPGC